MSEVVIEELKPIQERIDYLLKNKIILKRYIMPVQSRGLANKTKKPKESRIHTKIDRGIDRTNDGDSPLPSYLRD